MSPENLARVKNQQLRNEATTYGFRVTAPGFLSDADANVWLEDLTALVRRSRRDSFGLLVDIRGQRANPAGATATIKLAMAWLRKAGCVRSAVILDNPVALIQIRRLAIESGIYAYERYIDARADAAWEHTALDWIERAADPDQPGPGGTDGDAGPSAGAAG